MQPIIRPTGILTEENRILLVKQDVTESRHWALPGGKPEFGETIEQCLIREIKEETGLDVLVRELLYVCDWIHQNNHVIHMAFLLKRTGGKLRTSHELQLTKEKIKQIEMVPFDKLQEYGFSLTFQELVKSNFPERGSYKGDFKKFYGTW